MVIKISVPGRIALFGEHSDYIGLNVLPIGINLRIFLKAEKRDDSRIHIKCLDINETDSFSIDDQLNYRNSRDYIRSAFNVMRRYGYVLENGYDIEIRGTLPQGSGLSSSTALTTTIVKFISYASGNELSSKRLAELAFEAEVKEFGESGGLMDHYAVAYGNVLHVQFNPVLKISQLPGRFSGLIIGDSLEPKEDTVKAIAYLKSTILSGYAKLREYFPDFKQYETPIGDVMPYFRNLPKDVARIVLTTLKNRDLTERAKHLLSKKSVDPYELGRLIYLHHTYLRDGLWRSTPKIEKLIAASLKAGALGAKMNGSGGGGTMMAYAPGKEKEVAKAIEKEGGRSYIVQIDSGARVDL